MLGKVRYIQSHMKILALDLGTHCGFAYNVGEGFTYSHWDLATAKEVRAWGKERLTRRRDPRPQRLCDRVLRLPLPELIVFEDVQFASSLLQVQLWSSLRTSLWMCLGDAVRFDCVPVQTLKKFACRGGADKKAMRIALAVQHPEIFSTNMTEDEVDAVWIWFWAKQNLSRAKI